MRKSETAAITTLVLLSHMLSPAIAGPASPLVIAQAQTQAPPAASTPAPAQPPVATTAPTTVVAPAEKSALSTVACGVKYLEVKVAGKLNGRKWVDFRRDECGKRETTAVFPAAISPKYENEKDIDRADQFTANKATNANGGLVWVEKDGGYYAECVIRLKG
jgi:hypothetical protein